MGENEIDCSPYMEQLPPKEREVLKAPPSTLSGSHQSNPDVPALSVSAVNAGNCKRGLNPFFHLPNKSFDPLVKPGRERLPSSPTVPIPGVLRPQIVLVGGINVLASIRGAPVRLLPKLR